MGRRVSSSHDALNDTLKWALSTVVSEARGYVSETFLVETLKYGSAYSAFRPDLLSLLLEAGNNPINTAVDPGGSPILHGNICCEQIDPQATAFLITRGADLHRKSYDTFHGQDIETPLSLAMRSRSTFYHWREALRGADVDLDEYLACACQEDLIHGWGWTKATLATLFEHALDIPLRELPGLPYCHCGSGWLVFESQWQGFLESKKGGQSQRGEEDIRWVSGTNDIKNPMAEDHEQDWEDISEGDEEQGRTQRWQDSHDFLCWHCWNEWPHDWRGRRRTWSSEGRFQYVDEINDCSNGGKTKDCSEGGETTDCSDGGDFTDEGDSPFLLSLPL